MVCISVREYLLRAWFVESTVPRTKSHFSSPDRAVLGQNAEPRMTGYLQPGSTLNAPYPHCTSLLNILNVAPLQCVKCLWEFSDMSFSYLPLKLIVPLHLCGKFLDKKKGWIFRFFSPQTFLRGVSIPIL